MLITHKIKMDIQRMGVMPYLDVVCGDAYTRQVEITLTAGGSDWPVPGGVSAVVRYSRSDGHGGMYDKLPDGKTACSINGNVVTAILAPQMLSAPGFAKVSVALIKEEFVLGMFPIGVNIKADPAMESTEGESYYNYASIGAINDAIGDLRNLQTNAKSNLVAAINEAAKHGGITDAEKLLILTLFRNAAYTSPNMGNTLAQLEALWSGSGDSGGEEEPDEPVTPGKTLTSISATYSGGNVAVGTAVTALTGIVVTAHYSDGTSETVTGYTLSGEIAEGENTVTVSYGGKTTTITVTGIAQSSGLPHYEYTVVGTGILTDTGTATPSNLYDITDFMDIDPNYSTLSVATYMDAASDARISSGAYVQWFNVDTFLSRTGGSPVIEIGNTKCTKPVVHTVPEGATKFRICVQNNCDRFVLYKGTVSASDI